jgi:hypothetical protein
MSRGEVVLVWRFSEEDLQRKTSKFIARSGFWEYLVTLVILILSLPSFSFHKRDITYQSWYMKIGVGPTLMLVRSRWY